MATDKFFKFFNLKRISDDLGLQPDKLYNNFKGDYNSLTPADCKNIADLLIPKVKDFFEFIGYDVTFKRVRSK